MIWENLKFISNLSLNKKILHLMKFYLLFKGKFFIWENLKFISIISLNNKKLSFFLNSTCERKIFNTVNLKFILILLLNNNKLAFIEILLIFYFTKFEILFWIFLEITKIVNVKYVAWLSKLNPSINIITLYFCDLKYLLTKKIFWIKK